MASDYVLAYFFLPQKITEAELIRTSKRLLDEGCRTTEQGNRTTVRLGDHMDAPTERTLTVDDACSEIVTTGAGEMSLICDNLQISVGLTSAPSGVDWKQAVSLRVKSSQFKLYDESDERTDELSSQFLQLIGATAEELPFKHAVGNVDSYFDQPRPKVQTTTHPDTWITVFSSERANTIGRDQVLDAPGSVVRELSDGSVLIAATTHPVHCPKLREKLSNIREYFEEIDSDP